MREATGDMIIVTYADDVIFGFQYESDAPHCGEAMRERSSHTALSLHPEKSRPVRSIHPPRLIEFGRFAAAKHERRGFGKPAILDFLGFSHICGKSRKGLFQIIRETRTDRLRAKLKQVEEGLRRRMHRPIPEQWGWLGRIIAAYCDYSPCCPTATP